MINSVELSCDAYLVCLTHALSTEKEEVMGLLLGEVYHHVCVMCMYGDYLSSFSDWRQESGAYLLSICYETF